MAEINNAAQAVENKEYILGRAEQESRRLNDQHYTLLKMFGFALHPSITERLGADSRIADIATGTAIWLQDLVTAYSETSQFHGFDISDAQYPPKDTLPSNVQLHIHSAKEPFPTKWHGIFDVVQIRCIAAAMKDGDWQVVFQNLLQLLKPGGAIQWIEPDLNQFLTPTCDATDLPPDAHARASNQVFKVSGLQEQRNDGPRILPEIFSKAGMHGIAQALGNRDSVPEMKRRVMMNMMDVMFHSLGTSAERGLDGAWTFDEVAKLREQAVQEVDRGCYYPVDFHMVVGFKSS